MFSTFASSLVVFLNLTLLYPDLQVDLQQSLFATNLFSIQIANLRRDSPRQKFGSPMGLALRAVASPKGQNGPSGLAYASPVNA